MSDPNDQSSSSLDTYIAKIYGFHPDVLKTYSRLWQLERWLRRMVYVELRACFGDNWRQHAKSNMADKSHAADVRLTHMPGPERDPLAYLSFGELCHIIVLNWGLYEPYLPPQDLWKSKIEEVRQVRHRVAHFRVGHEDDLRRVEQVLRDLDRGFWQFCSTYNDLNPVLPQSADPVAQHFLQYEQFPFQQIGENKWAQFGVADPQAVFDLSTKVVRRAWCKPLAAWPVASQSGYLYVFRFGARQSRVFDIGEMLEATQSLHERFIYIALDGNPHSFRIAVPAVIGADAIIHTMDRVVEVASSVANRTAFQSYDPQRLAKDWSPHVLDPDDLLVLIGPDMPGSFFQA